MAEARLATPRGEQIRGAFVTGTDTGVGKTVATAAIAWSLATRGQRVVVWKPAQTGVQQAEPGDAEFAATVLAGRPLVRVACSYRFAAPAAPLVAARAEGAALDETHLRAEYAALCADDVIVLAEGAGGLLVPLTEQWSMADLARALDLPLIVVARPGLGTINHTLLTLEAARARGLAVLGLVLSGWREPFDLATATNPQLLAERGRAPLLGVLPYDDRLSTERLEPGHLREWASQSVAPALGGAFDAERFLADCARRAARLAGPPPEGLA